MGSRVLAIALLPALAGCAEDDLGLPVTDASPAADALSPSPDAAPRDGSVPLSWVDFAIADCPDQPAPGELPCSGAAPLTLRFVALAPAPIDVYRWSFGDASGELTEASPEHTFELPGRYDISLTVGGPGGTARAAATDAVKVEPAPVGAHCELGLQCEGGSCICGDESCEAPLSQGLCSAPCSASSPCESGVCADLAAAEPEEPAPWQSALCVRACEEDADCPEGRACTELPAGDSEEGWIRGCFAPELLSPIGGSCTSGSGELVDEACASGLCVGEGARGMCSADCGDGAPCPESASCATFNGGELGSLCVHRCEGDAALCDDDPWLACEQAGGDGALGFSVDDEEPAESGYCAPKACSDAEDCGPDGTCTEGFCAPS